MSLKTENSRRVAKSRPVCMGLYPRKLWGLTFDLESSKVSKHLILNISIFHIFICTYSYLKLPWFQRFKINLWLKAAIDSSSRANQFELGRLLHLLFGVLRIFGTLTESNRKRSHDCSDCPYSKVGAVRTVM